MMKKFLNLTALMALGMSLLISSRAGAGLVVSATNPTTAAGTSGSFDVLLTNTDQVNSVEISTFNTAIEVASNSGLTWTGADETTTPGYIFGTVQNPPLDTISGFTITLSDLLSGTQTVGAGVTVGLAHVLYTLAPSTPAGVPIALSFTTGGTQIYDAGLNEILDLTLQGGTLTVTASAVPEPGSLVLAGLLAGAGGLAYRRRVRRSAATA